MLSFRRRPVLTTSWMSSCLDFYFCRRLVQSFFWVHSLFNSFILHASMPSFLHTVCARAPKLTSFPFPELCLPSVTHRIVHHLGPGSHLIGQKVWRQFVTNGKDPRAHPDPAPPHDTLRPLCFSPSGEQERVRCRSVLAPLLPNSFMIGGWHVRRRSHRCARGTSYH